MRHRGPTCNEQFRSPYQPTPRHRAGLSHVAHEDIEREFAAYMQWCEKTAHYSGSTRSAMAYEDRVGFMFIGGET